MNFTNEEIKIPALPSVEHVHFYPLEKKYLLARQIAMAVTFILIAVAVTAALYFIKKLQTPVIIYSVAGVLLLVTVVSFINAVISFRNSGYALREKDILSRHGFIIRKVRAVPLNRIQHVSIQSGPIERKFNLASVSIYTAGSSSADFTINGITGDTALQVKEWISNQINDTTT